MVQQFWIKSHWISNRQLTLILLKKSSIDLYNKHADSLSLVHLISVVQFSFPENIYIYIYIYIYVWVESKLGIWKHSPGGAFYVYYYYTHSLGDAVYYYDPQSERWRYTSIPPSFPPSLLPTPTLKRWVLKRQTFRSKFKLGRKSHILGLAPEVILNHS